jgi:hypothetical protein
VTGEHRAGDADAVEFGYDLLGGSRAMPSTLPDCTSPFEIEYSYVTAG